MSKSIKYKKKYIKSSDLFLPLFSKNQYKEYYQFKKLKTNNLPYINDIYHLSYLLGISCKKLKLLLSNKKIAYTTFRIAKKNGGYRCIDAPREIMKKIQRSILDNVLYKLNMGDFAHGFVPGKSIISNASEHVGQSLILGIDIKDFFPSIHINRIIGFFKSIGYKQEIACLLGQICTFKRRLPQGAPTSPALANLIAWHIDSKLSKFCEKRNLVYSRYADDITISGNSTLPKYKTIIFQKIKNEGFRINYDKVRLQGQGTRQKVTGLTVNKKVSLGRKKKKKLRAIVHNIVKNGFEMENRNNDPFFRKKIFGELSFAKMVDPEFANVLINKLKNIEHNKTNIICGTNECKKCKIRYIHTERNCVFCGEPLYSLAIPNIFIKESQNLMVPNHHIFACGIYHPYRKGMNPDYDDFSQKILNLKKIKMLDIESKKDVLNYFHSLISNTINVFENFVICIVPPHDKEKHNTGISILAKYLVGTEYINEKGYVHANRMIDGTDVIKRVKSVPKKSSGGVKDESLEIQSLDIADKSKIKNKQVLLIDDVVTHGFSLNICKKILVINGAKLVVPLALGETSKYNIVGYQI